MLGLHRFRTRSSLSILSAILAVAASVFVGCKAAEETGKQELPKETFKDFLARYEKTFDPSPYKVQAKELSSKPQTDSTGTTFRPTPSSAAPETTAGFRVQILTTQDIDQAMQLRDTLWVALPDEWVYVVHDAPYYKVRVGNFADRPSANKTVKTLIEKGYGTAWVVPDQVLRNPPLRPPAILPPSTGQEQHQNPPQN